MADFRSWREVACELASTFVDDRVRHEFLRAPPDYVVYDDLRWLDGIILRATGRAVDNRGLMADALRRRFDFVRCCHGTCTADVGSFYERGLLPMDPERVHVTAHSVFLGGRFPEVTEADLERAIQAVGHGPRADRVFFEVNERMLVEHCGHYLLYGSEYLLAIAAHLRPRMGRDYRPILKGRGTPTVFLCDVPMGAFAGNVIEAAGWVLACLFTDLLEGGGHEPEPYHGFGFHIPIALSPELLVGHYHPANVRDPLLR